MQGGLAISQSRPEDSQREETGRYLAVIRPEGCVAVGKPVELVSFFHDGRHSDTTVVVLSVAVPNWLVTDTVCAGGTVVVLVRWLKPSGASTSITTQVAPATVPDTRAPRVR